MEVTSVNDKHKSTSPPKVRYIFTKMHVQGEDFSLFHYIARRSKNQEIKKNVMSLQIFIFLVSN